MTRWEYMSIGILSENPYIADPTKPKHWRVNGKVNEALDGKRLIEVLNHFGSQGWEMVFEENDELKFYLKRPLT